MMIIVVTLPQRHSLFKGRAAGKTQERAGMGTRDIRGFAETLLGAERSPGWERGIPGWRHKQLPPRFSSSLEAPKKPKRSFKVCKNEQKTPNPGVGAVLRYTTRPSWGRGTKICQQKNQEEKKGLFTLRLSQKKTCEECLHTCTSVFCKIS